MDKVDHLTDFTSSIPDLIEKEERYRTILENSVEGSILINENGSIVEWNRFMENKTNIRKKDVVGKKIWEIQFNMLTRDFKKIYPKDSLEGIWLNYVSTLKMDETVSKEGQYTDKDGKLMLIEDIIFPMMIRGKKHLCIFQHDITERKILEQQLKNNEQKLLLLNQTKDRIISIISHDLRSPITAILGFSQMLCQDIKSENFKNLEEYTEHINTSLEHTLRLLDNLLMWSRTQTGQFMVNPGIFKLNPLIKEIIQGLDSSASLKNITVNYVTSGEIIGYADVNILKIVLRNLIHNAIKFTGKGGKVDVSATSVNDQLEIIVADNGIGLNEDSCKQLFQSVTNKSKTGTANEKGSGLGLILCKELIEKHGGRIWVESKLGKGSQFKFSLQIQ